MLLSPIEGPAIPNGYTGDGYDAVSESSDGPNVGLEEAIELWHESPATRALTAFAYREGSVHIMSVWDEWADGWGWSPWEVC